MSLLPRDDQNPSLPVMAWRTLLLIRDVFWLSFAFGMFCVVELGIMVYLGVAKLVRLVLEYFKEES